MKKQIRKQFTLWKLGLRQPPDRSLRLIVFLLAFLLLLPTGAQAALLEVDRTDDDASATACTAAPLDCSLRGAVLTANNNDEPDTIHLPAGTYLLTLVGEDGAAAVGDLDLLDDSNSNPAAFPDIVLTGDGPAVSVIDAGGILKDRVVEVLEGATIRISGLTIRGGNPQGLGGSPPFGGGIWTHGNLTLTDVIVTDNHCTGPNGEMVGDGGGVKIAGTLLVQNSIIGPNNTAYSGGAFHNQNGTLDIIDTTVVGNAGKLAGGLRSDGGTVTIRGSTFRDNFVDGPFPEGAAISNLAFMTIENTTVSSNIALNESWAIESRGNGSLTLTNVTISGSTIWANAMDADCCTTVTLRNSLILGWCKDARFFVSGGGNLEGPWDTCGLTEVTDQVNVIDPELGPLMDNGGPTATHALLTGSRAIDAAVNANCPVVDQRGFLRDDRCDTGSFEFGASEKPVALTMPGSGRPDIH